MIEKIKYKLKNSMKQSIVRTIFKKTYHTYSFFKETIKKPNYNANEKEFTKYMKNLVKQKDFTFIVVGANDGVRSDPLHPYINKNKNIQGVFIEPQKKLFKMLKKNLSSLKKASFENVAIDIKSGTRKLYRLKDSAVKEQWHEGIASFTPDKNALSGFSKSQIEIELVKTETFSRILKKYKMKSISYLQIDTEGYDYEIIKTIDFTKIKPSIIRFERININPYDTDEYKKFFRKLGYKLTYTDMDCIAYLKDES